MSLYTVPEAAEYLRVHRSTVYALIADGDLPVVDISRKGSTRPKSRIRTQDLDRWIKTRTRTNTKGRRT